jgi:hypothetical protein
VKNAKARLPRQQIAYAAANIVTRRSMIAKRPQAAAAFMQVMAEAAKISPHQQRIYL